MKKLLTGLMLSVSVLLTACGEFQSINKSSNEVLEALSPYLVEEDQQRAQELSAQYNKDILIRENLIDAQVIEIEIEGHVAQLEVVNKGDIALKLNGKNIYFDELANRSLLESVIASSLVKVSANTGVMSLLEAKKSEAFIGTLLSGVFGLVVKGIFNYAVVKITEKVGPVVGGAVGTIGDSLVGGATGTTPPTGEAVSSAKDTILSAILNMVINRISGGSVTIPPVVVDNGSVTVPTLPTNPTQPVQNCNLFCNLLGLLVGNLVK